MLNGISTGASNDLEVAMQIARDMIIVYGMNDKIGPMSINLNQDPYEHLLHTIQAYVFCLPVTIIT